MKYIIVKKSCQFSFEIFITKRNLIKNVLIKMKKKELKEKFFIFFENKYTVEISKKIK